jgi:hypothetical protein
MVHDGGVSFVGAYRVSVEGRSEEEFVIVA